MWQRLALNSKSVHSELTCYHNAIQALQAGGARLREPARGLGRRRRLGRRRVGQGAEPGLKRRPPARDVVLARLRV